MRSVVTLPKNEAIDFITILWRAWFLKDNAYLPGHLAFNEGSYSFYVGLFVLMCLGVADEKIGSK